MVNLFFGISVFICFFCLSYYFLIIAYAGFGASFSGFWLFTGLISLAAGVLFWNLLHTETEIPGLILWFVGGSIALFGMFFLIIMGKLLSHSHKKGMPNLDYIIILGAQVRGQRITKSLKKRLDQGITYLTYNQNTIVIVSGGQGKGEEISEAAAMQKYLVQQQIPECRILMEAKSRNTYENIYFSNQLLSPNTSVGIVTNGFHIYRATHLAKKQGLLKVSGIAAPTDKVLALNYYIREVFGVIKDKLYKNM